MNKRMSSTSLSALALVLIISINLVGCSGAEERQAKYLKRAEELFTEENYEKAQLEVKNVLQINPKNAEARVLLAKIFIKKKNFRQAFANFNAAAEEDENNVTARVELAKIYFLSGENDKSKAHADKALELDPNNKEARIVRASLLARSGEMDQAEKISQQVLAEYPGESAAIAILVNIYGKNNIHKALDIVDKGLASDPKNEKLKNIKIQILTKMKDSEGVRLLLEELVAEHPQHIDYYYDLAAGYARSNNPEKVKELLTQAIANNPDDNKIKFRLVDYINQQNGAQAGIDTMKTFIDASPENFALREALVKLYLGIGQRDQAVELLENLIKKDKISGDALRARNSLAELALFENNTEEAKKYLKQIFELDATNANALVTRARIKIADNDMKAAIADLRAALKNDPESISALKLLGFVQERDGTPTLALDTYIRLTELDRNDGSAYFNAGRLSLGEQKIDNAKVFLERSVDLQPLSVEAVTLLARVLVKEQHWDEAREHVQPLIKDEATKGKGILLLANIYRSENNWEYATGLYRQALELNPSEGEAIAGYVDTFIVKNDYPGAIAFLKKHLSQYPELNFAKDLLAQMHLRNQEPQPAIAIYKDLIKEKPEIELAYQKLAAIYQQQGEIKQAQATLQQGVKAVNTSIGLRLLLANLYQQQNEFSAAKQQYETVIEQRENIALAKNNLAMLLINQFPSDENYTRALNLAADFQNSKNPIFLDTLGWVHYHMNNIPQAISFLQAAVERKKDNSEYRYHLGMAYHKSGEQGKAKEQLILALKNTSERFQGIEEAKATLDKLQES